MKIVSMNGLNHDMVNLLFEIQKVISSLDVGQRNLLLKTIKNASIAALDGQENIFIPLKN